jgi:hypothetical protein
MKTVALMMCTLFMLSLFAGPLAAAEEVQINWGEEYIKTRGLGSFKGNPSSRKLIIAREKAKARAERDLLGVIYELNIDADTTIKETMESDEYTEIIRKQIKGTLRGAKVLAEGQLNRNTYEVIMGVKFSDVRKATLINKEPDEVTDEDNPIIMPSRNFMNLGNPGVTNLNYMQAAGAQKLPADTSAATPHVHHEVTGQNKIQVGSHGQVTSMVTDDAPSGVTTPVSETPAELSEDELNAALVGALPGQVLQGRDKEVPPMPTKPFTPPAGHSDVASVSGGYTSLIVDARALNADRAFWPRLLDSSKEVIYGNYDATVDFLQDEGAVAYCLSIEDARKCPRAGNNPLVVRASGVAGKYRADLVVTSVVAEQVRKAAVKDGFLSAYRVMFVLD